jgi:hypothetical protein
MLPASSVDDLVCGLVKSRPTVDPLGHRIEGTTQMLLIAVGIALGRDVAASITIVRVMNAPWATDAALEETYVMLVEETPTARSVHALAEPRVLYVLDPSIKGSPVV